MLPTLKMLQTLKHSLSKSTGVQRKEWATEIIEKEIVIRDLFELVNAEQKTASRFLWLLSDIGILFPEKLKSELPYLFNICKNQKSEFKTSFASFWLYADVPTENEGEAIDLLFGWVLSSEVNVTIKSRALLVLFKLSEKYPEIKNELKLCIQDQLVKHSKDFKKRANKLLLELGD